MSNTYYIGRQSGGGFMDDMDLYNVTPMETTVSVPAGAPASEVAQKAAEAVAAWQKENAAQTC